MRWLARVLLRLVGRVVLWLWRWANPPLHTGPAPYAHDMEPFVGPPEGYAAEEPRPARARGPAAVPTVAKKNLRRTDEDEAEIVERRHLKHQRWLIGKDSPVEGPPPPAPDEPDFW